MDVPELRGRLLVPIAESAHKPIRAIQRQRVLLLGLGNVTWVRALAVHYARILKSPALDPEKLKLSAMQELQQVLGAYLEHVAAQRLPRNKLAAYRRIQMLYDLMNEGLLCKSLLAQDNLQSIGRTTITDALDPESQDILLPVDVRTNSPLRNKNVQYWTTPDTHEHFKQVTKHFIDLNIYHFYAQTLYFSRALKKNLPHIIASLLKHKEHSSDGFIAPGEENIIKALLILSPSAMRYAISDLEYAPGHRPSSFANLVAALKPTEQRFGNQTVLDEVVQTYLHQDPIERYSDYTFLLLCFLITDLGTNRLVEHTMPINWQEMNKCDVDHYVTMLENNPSVKEATYGFHTEEFRKNIQGLLYRADVPVSIKEDTALMRFTKERRKNKTEVRHKPN